MAYFFALKNLLINTHKLESLSLNDDKITVVTEGGINNIQYDTPEEAKQQYDEISEKIRNNKD